MRYRFKMNHVIRLVFLFVLILATKDIRGQNVKVTASTEFPVSKYATFKMGHGDLVMLLKRELPDSAIRAHIQVTMVDLMQRRGYVLRDDTTADLRVSYLAEVLEKVQEENIGPLGQQPADQAAQLDQSHTWTQVSNETVVTIEIREAKSGKVIWKSSTSS